MPVKLAELALALQGRFSGALTAVSLDPRTNETRPVLGLRYDSRRVQPGDLFVCIRGTRTDGHLFALEATARGAVAVVAERPLPELPAGVAQLVVPDTREALGVLARVFYGDPSRRLRLVGVTGTNGKTTTTHLVKAILEAAGNRVGLIGTIRHLVGDRVLEAERTTPESVDLQALLRQMVEAGASYAVTEVSSHAVALKRIAGTEYDVGVFTNLTQDHLDFHGSLEEYFEAKARFFDTLADPEAVKGGKAAAINADDPWGVVLSRRVRVPAILYGLREGAAVRASEIEVTPAGARFTAQTPRAAFPVRLHITGRFNVYNALAAISVGVAEGLDLGAIRSGLESVRGVPGRFEAVWEGQPFAVIVDYAHTPDGLENVLRTARQVTSGRVIAVFGAGGDRDAGKRPQMGAVAGRMADHTVITSDNPRSEEPASICRQIEAGLAANLRPGASYEVVVDRREAIRRAIALAQPGDLVLIAGKGHETYQIFADRTIHFDDREEASQALRERASGGVANP